MWKSYAAPYPSAIKNKYFFDLFILGFIECLIDHKNYGVTEFKAHNWLEYLEYLKDYTKSLGEEELLDFNSYRKYYMFRKDKEKFMDHIEKST